MKIANEHIEFIESDLRDRGAKTQEIINELSDRVLTEIESGKRYNENFYESYFKIISSFGNGYVSKLEKNARIHYAKTPLKKKLKPALIISITISFTFVFTAMIFALLNVPNALLLLKAGMLITVIIGLPFVSFVYSKHVRSSKSLMIGYTSLLLMGIGFILKYLSILVAAKVFVFAGIGTLCLYVVPKSIYTFINHEIN